MNGKKKQIWRETYEKLYITSFCDRECESPMTKDAEEEEEEERERVIHIHIQIVRLVKRKNERQLC
jgi:hypothetical protein